MRGKLAVNWGSSVASNLKSTSGAHLVLSNLPTVFTNKKSTRTPPQMSVNYRKKSVLKSQPGTYRNGLINDCIIWFIYIKLLKIRSQYVVLNSRTTHTILNHTLMWQEVSQFLKNLLQAQTVCKFAKKCRIKVIFLIWGLILFITDFNKLHILLLGLVEWRIKFENVEKSKYKRVIFEKQTFHENPWFSTYSFSTARIS